MILGIIIRHRRYTLSKYFSVGMVTLGILICTFASGKNLSKETHHSPEEASSDFVTWLIGEAFYLPFEWLNIDLFLIEIHLNGNIAELRCGSLREGKFE